jgi:cell division protein FtsZ
MVTFDRTSTLAADAAPLRICIAAVGGAGSNVMERIVMERSVDATLLSLQTDVRVLASSCAPTKIQLGDDLMRGVGAGGDPELGREAAIFSRDAIRAAVEGHDMVFLTVGLGGGTGSGAAPIVAEIAKSAGALVFVFAAVPFGFEGRRRQGQAKESIERLERVADALVLFENDRMGELVVAKDGITKAFMLADQTVSHSIRAVASMVSSPGLVKLSMGDLMAALRATDSRCLFGHGEASGKDRGTDALKRALQSPLISEGALLQTATSLLVHIVGGENLTLVEVEGIMRQLGRRVPDETQIHFGLGVNPKMADKLSVTLISSMSASALAAHREAEAAGIVAELTAPVVAPVAKPKPAPVALAPVAAVAVAPAPEPKPAPVVVETPPAPVAVVEVPVAEPQPPVPQPVAVEEPAPQPEAPAPKLKPKAPTSKPKAPPLLDDLFESFAPQPAPAAAPVQQEPAFILQPEEPAEAPPEPLFEPQMAAELQEIAEEPLPEPARPITTSVLIQRPVPQPVVDQAPVIDEVTFEEPEFIPVEDVVEDVIEVETPPAIIVPVPETAPVPRAMPVLGKPVPRSDVKTAPVVKPAVIQQSDVEPVAPSIVHSPVAPAPVVAKAPAQPSLAIASPERSPHFKGADDTIVQGEDLDTPTWMRMRRKVTR